MGNKYLLKLVVKFVADPGDRDGTEETNSNAGSKPKIYRRQKAVALSDREKSGTHPRVVASGEGGVAEQIIQLAWANDIKVREDADLVEILSAIDVESEIPIEAFAAVAEILSYVYRANAGLISLEDSKDN